VAGATANLADVSDHASAWTPNVGTLVPIDRESAVTVPAAAGLTGNTAIRRKSGGKITAATARDGVDSIVSGALLHADVREGSWPCENSCSRRARRISQGNSPW
jgi:hypothetical protein